MFRISGKEKYRERELKAPSQPRSRLRPRSATEGAVGGDYLSYRQVGWRGGLPWEYWKQENP